MIIVCAGDIHAAHDRPTNRVDNYWATILRKLNFIFDVADKNHADVVIFPGDFTNTPALPYVAFTDLVTLLRERGEGKVILTCTGQHDLRFRTKPNTALVALENSVDHLSILNNSTGCVVGDVRFSGSGYGEEVPEPEEGIFNVLIIHRMIIEEKLWSAQETYEPANIFLRQHNYDLICSGDNHRGFIARSGIGGNRLLVNCGAMMRNSVALLNHQPVVVVYNTKTRMYEQVFIPIETADKVFRVEKVEAEKERNQNLEAFVSGLSDQKEVGLLFEDNLIAFSKENNIGSDVMNIIYDSFKSTNQKMGEYRGKEI